ncbi:hypothetical protein EV385_3248 [Krasilnikovia cinnamomea]|uniref:Uncharacterized protein n=1 Tax=Krasilnikovia cinnamomea TaxID=349313 RepID=A0A4Q7ZLE8_9ACTN|nr:hypothetical protein EV385_3248 [Krasilnikovia cinnamomea]
MAFVLLACLPLVALASFWLGRGASEHCQLCGLLLATQVGQLKAPTADAASARENE